MTPRRITFLLIWLALTAEVEGEVFSGKWATPLTWLGTAIFKPLPGIKFPIWDIAVIATLVIATMGASRERVRPMITSMKVALASIAALWVWGVVRGGDIRQTMWQLHNFVIAIVLAFVVAATCRTTKHIASLGKVILFAALYRAFVLMIFYFTVARGLEPPLQTLTTHADSALFVTGMLVLIVNAMERRSVRTFMWMVLGCIPLALAIKWNNRRLAWLSLMIGVALCYYVLPRSRFKRTMNWLMFAMVPLGVAYVAVGWGHTSGIFRPVGAISTMFGTHADASSEMRDIENYNLLQTLKSNPLLGTGWGHEYREVSVGISIKDIFEQYRFIPHNSVLGLLAFSGLLGFATVWQLFVVAVYFHAASVRAALSPIVRIAGIVGLTTIATVLLQMWGDMGWNTLSPVVLVAASIGVAVRLPVAAGAWPERSKPRRDEESRKDPDGAEHAERDNRLPQPALLASVARIEERDRERGHEDAEDDKLSHR